MTFVPWRLPALVMAAVVALTLHSSAQTDNTRPLAALELQRSQLQQAIKTLPVTPGRPFAEQAPSTTERAQSSEARVKRARSVAINQDYIQRMLAAAPLQIGADGALVGAPQQFVLNLFDDLDVAIVKLAMTRNELGLTVYTGGIVGDPLGSATIILGNGEVTASIVANGHDVSIFPMGDGVHRVREMSARSSSELYDPATRQENDAVRPPRPAPDSAAPSHDFERSNAINDNLLRVLVVYTPSAAALISNMPSAVSLAMADLNTTLSNSQTNTQAVLVGLEKVSYTEGSSTPSQILNDATNQVGDFARIHQMRSVVQADLVAVISGYASTTNCGIAWLNDDVDQFQNSLSSVVKYGVSLTSAAGCLPTTFTHETGHNLGANHDRFQIGSSAVAGPTGYNYGYVDTTAKFRDVMAYDDQCDSLSITCPRIQYYSNPSVTYTGRPIGIADSLPEASNNSRRIREIAPVIARFRTALTLPTTPMLAVFVSGAGSVTTSSGGINCGGGGVCSASITGGGSITLTPVTPAGTYFSGWSGACTGTGACSVSMTTSRSVSATFVPALRLGAVYASTQPAAQSFMRFANIGSGADTVSVVLANSTTGQTLGTWNSPSIPAGSALQVPITTIETALPAGTATPQYYSAAVQSQMTGYIQHVLYRPADGTLTNLSTCDSGVAINTTQVANVHSTILDFGFPSTIAITNTGFSSGTTTLGIYDSSNGVKLGTYPTASIPRDGQLLVSVATIEAATGIKPTAVQYHYTIKHEGTLSASLQHLVNNLSVGVNTDMTTVCAFGTVTAPPSTVAINQPGPIFSSGQSASQSFLRFYNTGTTSGTVNVTMANSTTGSQLASWTSPTIAPGASAQYPITTPETSLAAGTTKPSYYSTALQTQITGYFQHVLYRPADGTLTNLSTCDIGVASLPTQLINVHSTILDFGFPSSIVVSNPSSAATTATLGIYDARNGVKINTYTTASIAAGGQLIIPIAAIESALGITPASDMYHYVIKTEGSFTGFLQHLVNNKNVGVVTDMTTMCQLPATKAVSYTSCWPTSCSMTAGTTLSGQIKKAGGYANYRLTLTGGQLYTIDIKGASTSNGTLTKPYMFVSDSNFSTLKFGGGGGTGNDARLTFTPTTTGTYTIQVTTYVYDNNAGTFTIAVN